MSDTIEQTAIAVIHKAQLPTLVAVDKTDILGRLRADLIGYTPDASTPSGRAEIGSKAKKVGIAKQDFVRLAKTQKEDHQAIINSINAELKIIETNCDTIRDTILAPREAYEAIEKERIKGHEDALIELENRILFGGGEPTSEEIYERMNMPQTVRNWQEFEPRYQSALQKVATSLKSKLDVALKREAEAAELARLRAEQAERDRLEVLRAQAEREAQIAQEAAEKARLTAEAEAAHKADEARAKAEQEARDAAEAAKRERQRIETAARAEQARVEAETLAAEERATKAERERLDAIEAGKRAALAAEQREKEVAALAEQNRIAAEQKAEQDRLAAIEDERRRVAAERQAEAEAAQKREANIAHKRKINLEIVEDLMAAGLGQEAAIKVVTAIAKRAVRHTAISY